MLSRLTPCPPIDSIMRLMTVWRKTEQKNIFCARLKIIRTAIFNTYHNYNRQLLQFRFPSFFCVLCFVKVKLSAKVKLFVALLCVCAIFSSLFVDQSKLSNAANRIDSVV